MTRETKIGLFLAAGGAAVAGAAYWSSREEDGGFVDTTIDKLTLITSNETSRMDQLQPEVQAKLLQLIGVLSDQGIRVYVGQTLRTAAQEKANVDNGKTAAGLQYSWHELGRAVDLYPIDPDTGKADLAAKRIDLFQQMHAAAKTIGWRGIAFEADGVTKKIIKNSKGHGVWDGGHLEWRSPHATILAAITAEGSDYGIG
jgi:hypothetical protein